MAQEGRIVRIFTAQYAGLPMQDRLTGRFLKGAGIEGDRYSTGEGFFSKSRREIPRHVTLISMESIERVNLSLVDPFSMAETRRNIVVSGLDLNSLVGRELIVTNFSHPDGIRLVGVELCKPCNRPSRLSDKPGFEEAFSGQGGLRARVLQSGNFWRGNSITI